MSGIFDSGIFDTGIFDTGVAVEPPVAAPPSSGGGVRPIKLVKRKKREEDIVEAVVEALPAIVDAPADTPERRARQEEIVRKLLRGNAVTQTEQRVFSPVDIAGIRAEIRRQRRRIEAEKAAHAHYQRLLAEDEFLILNL